MRARLTVLVSVCMLLLAVAVWHLRSTRLAIEPAAPASSAGISPPQTRPPVASDSLPTAVYAHNLMLRKGPAFRIYVRWLRGNMIRTQHGANPTLDDPESFFIEVKTGVIRANIGDIGNFLNAEDAARSPLRNITLLADRDQIKLKGTLHKLISIPVELLGSIAAMPDNRIQFHVTKLSALNIPLKGLLGGLHISVADLFNPKGIPGVEVSGNDILFDTRKLLPAPHITGRLTRVRVVTPDIEEVYGNAEQDVTRVEQWRNFLRLSNGTIDFGKLTMHDVDLTMVDISNDEWFDLDLNNYQNQLVNGYTRMTPEAGVQIFMPDLDTLPKNNRSREINMEWLKHRSVPPPPDVTSK